MFVFQSTKLMGGDQSQTHQPVQPAPDAFKTAHEKLVSDNLASLGGTFASMVSGINFPSNYAWSGGYGFKDATITRCVFDNPETHKKTEGFFYKASDVKVVFLANGTFNNKNSPIAYIKYTGKQFSSPYTLKQLNVEEVGQPASLTVLKGKQTSSSQLDSEQAAQKDGAVLLSSPALFKDQGVGKTSDEKFYPVVSSIPKSFGDDILLESGMKPDTYATIKLDRLETDLNTLTGNRPTLLKGVDEVKVYSLAIKSGSALPVYKVGSRYLSVGGVDVLPADVKRLKDENTTIQIGSSDITAPVGTTKRTLRNGQSILVSSEALEPAATRTFTSLAPLGERNDK